MKEDEKLTVRLVCRDGRRWYDPASKARVVAACPKPGVSVSRLAFEHGINATLLRKWIKADPERRPSPSEFVPVVAEDEDSSRSRELGARRDDMRLANSERSGSLSSPVKVSASLPNGVKLTLECGGPNALSALIGELSNVPTGR